MTIYQDLLAKQLEREQGMVDAGVKRYRTQAARLRAQRSEHKAAPMKKLTKGLLEPLAGAIAKAIEDSLSGRPSRRPIAVRQLKSLEPEVVSYLTLRAVFDLLSARPDPVTLAMAISGLIEDELRFRAFHAEEPHLWEKVSTDVARRSGHYAYQRKVAVGVGNRNGIAWEAWSRPNRVQVGMWLIDRVVQTCGVIEVRRYRPSPKVTKLQVEATEEAAQWIAQYDELAALLSPVFKPLVLPPRRWTTPFDGGYHSPNLRKPPLVKTHSPEYLQELRTIDMPLVYDAVNTIQSTAWAINKPLLDVMEAVMERDWTVGGFMSSALDALPARPVDIATNEEARRDYRRRAAAVWETNHSRRSRNAQAAFCVSVAREYRDEENLYFAYNLDFRSRLYALSSYLSPQGPDYARSLLRFAQGKPLGDWGGYWLAVHGANCAGEDKLSMDGRVEWVYAHTNDILAAADSPLEARWWMDTDKPWGFLAFCFEWAEYWRSGQSEEYVSHLPVALDGSANGLQHLSALLRDEVAGAAVNLTPSESPADLYQRVADRVAVRAAADAAAGDPIAARWANHITRQIVKQPTMTLPYGARIWGFRGQILNAIQEARLRGEDFPGWTPHAFEEANYLSKVVWGALDDVVRSAKEAMAWLQKLARAAAKEDLPVTWYSPLGFPIQQAYRTTAARRVQCRLGGTFVYVSVLEPTDALDAGRQANGISPNFIHSLDASHLMATVLRATAAGVTHFALIHDSYGTHAADTPALATALRDAFVEMHSSDLLSEFREQMVAQLTPDTVAGLDPLPTRGALEIEGVRASPFFFA